jgi:hypothetical protein
MKTNRSKKVLGMNMGKTSSTSSQLHTRPNCNVKLLEQLKEEMFHSFFHFHIAHVNISSKHSCIPMSNSKMWEMTQQIVNVES